MRRDNWMQASDCRASPTSRLVQSTHVQDLPSLARTLHPAFNRLPTPIFRRYTRLTLHRGKGTPRRKVKKVHKTAGADDKKLQATLKKMNVQPIQAIEEVNMFKEDGNVIHFANPRGKPPTSPLRFHGEDPEERCETTRGKKNIQTDTTPLFKSTPPSPPTPSPSTATARRRNSPSWSPVS